MNRVGFACLLATLVVLIAAAMFHRGRGAAAPAVQPDDSDTQLSSLYDITNQIGIDFIHEPGGPSFFLPETVGSGLAMLDYDGDGLLDLALRSGTAAAPHPDATSTSSARTRLFRQVSPSRFVDVTDLTGLGDRSYGMGIAVGDINNDGYADVYTVNFGPDRLYLNQRNGSFADITESAGIDDSAWGSSACLVDIDRDGRLDLFVAHYLDYSIPRVCTLSNGRVDYCNPMEYAGTPDRLYRNVTNSAGAVRFEDVSVASGIAAHAGPGLGVRACDANDDGWPDIFVANDGQASFLWINQRDGSFREAAVPLGVAYNATGAVLAGMGVAEGDVDGDGAFDIVVTNIRAGGHALYRRNGGSFDEIGGRTGLASATYAHTGFGVALADLDHDGHLDMITANGHVYQSLDRPSVLPPPAGRPDSARAQQFRQAYNDRCQLLIGDGTGRLTDVSPTTGSFGSQPQVSRGLAAGDLDGDGDIDLALTNVAGPARVYRNDFVKRGNWLVVRAVDPMLGGRDAYGAVVSVWADGRRWIRRVQPGSSYQSSDDPQLHFGLGLAAQIDHIDVQWPHGPLDIERFEGGEANVHRLLQRGQGRAAPEQVSNP